MNIVVIDGQSGRMGQLFIQRVRAAGLECPITAIGTNAIATSAMRKAGAEAAATGIFEPDGYKLMERFLKK